MALGKSYGIAAGWGCGAGQNAVTMLTAPTLATPTGGTIYVSGAGATLLPTGNDTAGTGTILAPYATLTKALTTISAAGNILVLCDGTFAENSGGNGVWIMAGVFSSAVLMRSYGGSVSTFIITNASANLGAAVVRDSAVTNLQIQYATLQTQIVEGMTVFRHNPNTSSTIATNLSFFDCTLKAKTDVSRRSAITLNGDNGVRGLYFVRCSFQRTAGASTATNPAIISVGNQTQTISNQPHRSIGFFGCLTTDNQWDAFSSGLSGVGGFTAFNNTFSTNKNHAFLIGFDTSGGNEPNCTNVYVGYNTFDASGTNPHGLEISGNCSGSRIEWNVVSTTLQGIVCKGSTNAFCQNNTTTGSAAASSGALLYAKGSTGTTFDRNTAILTNAASTAYVFREGYDEVTGIKAGGTVLTNNTLIASGAGATVLRWGGASDSLGGGRANNNAYTVGSGSALGTIRGTTVTSLAALQAAWVSAGLSGDVPTNDSASTVS